jgi:peroxiredoxin
MRLRVLQLILLAVVVGACAAPQDRSGQAAPAAPAATATSAAAAPKSPANPLPPGMLAAERRRPAPPLRVTAFDGRGVDLERSRGRPVVVSFFESWCPICEVEQPDLSRVAAGYAGQVDFVGVSYHDTVAAGRAYQRQFDVPYPLANDASGRTWAAWRVPYQPVTVVVDQQGRVARRFDGEVTPEELRPVLAYLIDE